MLYANFAVCGDQEESAICCLCGFIAEADDWNNFDHAWNTLLANSRTHIDVINCLLRNDIVHFYDIFQCHDLLAGLSEALTHSALLPIGSFVIREDYSRLSPADRAVLASEGIESPLDVIFHDLVERTIRRVHEESEKVSLLTSSPNPQSTFERYREAFTKHLGRYLLGSHLMGALTIGDPRKCSYLQAAMLLCKAVILVEAQQLSPAEADTSLVIPRGLQTAAKIIHEQGRFGAAALHKLAESLKKP